MNVDTDALAKVEEGLSCHPDFGDADLIERRAAERLRFSWEILAERLPGISAVLPTLRDDSKWPQIARDPVVRRATGEAIVELRNGEIGRSNDLQDILASAVAYATPGDWRVPTSIEERAELWAGPDRRIWVLDWPDDGGKLSRRLTRSSFECFLGMAGAAGEMNPGDARTVALLDQAANLLVALLPRLGPGLLRHVTAVGTITAQSDLEGFLLSVAGGSLVPGAIGIRRDQLENPWDAAGRILHEGLHLKIFNIAACSPLFTRSESSTGTRVKVPWRQISWDSRRALAAFHVYTHMVLLSQATALRGASVAAEFGDPPENPGVSTSEDENNYAGPETRFRYLAEQLLGPLGDGLTPVGRRFVRWQVDAVGPLIGLQFPPATATDEDSANEDSRANEFLDGDGYVQSDQITLRRCPDIGSLLAYNPATRILHVMNPSAWVAYELCDGRNLAELRTAYANILSGKIPNDHAAAAHLTAALKQLQETGLIEAVK